MIIQYFYREFIVMAFLTIGVSIEMIAGDFDLSFAAQVAASTVLGAFCLSRGMGLFAALLLMCIFHMLLGALKGFMMVKFCVPPIIMTLALQKVLAGLSAGLTGESSIMFHSDCQFYNNYLFKLGNAAVFLLLLSITTLLLNRSYYGRYCRMIGENMELAKESGLNCTGIAVLIHCFSSLFFFIAAVILLLETSSGSTYLGTNYLYKVLAAACIGGIGFGTGEGKVSGMIRGNLWLVLITFLLLRTGRSNQFETIIEGILIVLSLSLQKWRKTTENTPTKSEMSRIEKRPFWR